MKAKILSLLALLISLCASYAVAQKSQSDLYMPIEFQKAYQNGTRQWDGTVSPRYWQNRSEYDIKAEVNPHTKILKGQAKITYYNNSPDSIRRPGFHTYHDYYRNGSKRGGFFAGGEYPVTEGVKIAKLVIDGETYDLGNRREVFHNGTNYVISLKKILPPKQKMQLEIEWEYTIPGEGFERSGAIDSTSMFVAYWYPEMAVLDDIDGWDRVIYDAATEFYHDYSDYKVEITAPDNFMLWASVMPDNADAVYSDQVKARLAQAKGSTEGVAILTEADFKNTASKNLTWKYTATNFPDFAFALSDHFVWDAASYKDQNGEYFIHTAYPASSTPFKAVLKTISASLKIFHNDFPRYPFPYKNFTIFNGLQGGGMEFPGMANDEAQSAERIKQWTGIDMDDFEANLGLTLHEMCHMYFPFLMGINEKKYAWMDEGMASFSGFFLEERNWGDDEDEDNDYIGSQSIAPPMVPSYIASNSGFNSYTIGSNSYYALYRLLGKEAFLNALKTYMDTWKYKHPTPYDFFFIFNKATGKNLNWFWKAWYFDWGYMDVGIKSFEKNTLVVENFGGRPIPFNIRITYSDGTNSEEEVSPEVWQNSKTFTRKINLAKGKSIAEIRLLIPHSSDASGTNNVWRAPK